MTTTATKVETKWETKKVQEATTQMFAGLFLSAHEVISKLGGKAQEEFEQLLLKHKIEHYKKLGVKTPIELVKAIAETEHNVFGSQIEISGDEKRATLKYNSCGLWEASKKLGKFTPEQEKEKGERCAASMTQLAKEFGFNFEPKFTDDNYEMTFSK